jgi:hypothetical protein
MNKGPERQGKYQSTATPADEMMKKGPSRVCNVHNRPEWTASALSANGKEREKIGALVVNNQAANLSSNVQIKSAFVILEHIKVGDKFNSGSLKRENVKTLRPCSNRRCLSVQILERPA